MSHNPKTLLESYDILPKRSLGQNFMHDPNALEKIVASAEPHATDTVVEVGAGTGALTELLAEAVKRVYAIEVDQRLRTLLEERFEEAANVYLVFGDILKTDIAALVGASDYITVANAPYYISSAILWRFLESSKPPRRIILTMQHEVAERIIGAPGAMNLLSIAVHFYGIPRIVSKLDPAVFWPRPNIDSAIVRIDTHERPPVEAPSSGLFFRVVKAGFSMKRKQLKNALAGGLRIRASLARDLLKSAEIDPQRRARGFRRPGQHQRLQAGLAGGIGAPIGAGCGIARDEHRPACRRAAEQRVRSPDQAQDGGEVGVEHALPDIVGGLVRRAERAECSGAGGEYVQPPEPGAEGGDGAFEVSGRGKVQRAERGEAAGRPRRVIGLLQPADGARKQHDMGARRGQPHRRRPAEPPGCSGHQRDPAVERFRLRHGRRAQASSSSSDIRSAAAPSRRSSRSIG